ncbi:MAG: SDR family oxidoreductase [Rhodocyclaceae bacterium]|nr:MAG: SDR family oxidoreductase [Rhodocyclaceae bacterium]
MPAETRHALITGAALGIGAAVARRLADDGWALLLLDRNGDALAALADECRTRGARATALCAELGPGEHWLPPLKAALGTFGYLDLLVNNAGVADENEPDDVAAWQRVMAINLDAPFRLSAVCLLYLRDGGRIVNVASVLARAGKIRNTAYCASKHGLLGYTKALALDLAPRGITVNAVLPGWVDTPMLQRELGAQAAAVGTPVAQVLRNARRQIPLKRFVQAEEVANLVHYLASPAAAGITAQGLVVDGGYTCGM